MDFFQVFSPAFLKNFPDHAIIPVEEKIIFVRKAAKNLHKT